MLVSRGVKDTGWLMALEDAAQGFRMCDAANLGVKDQMREALPQLPINFGEGRLRFIEADQG
jgi:hypothetical protein